MDRFEAMTVFVAIAYGGSLSAAARQLEQPLATVSRKLAQLEAQRASVVSNLVDAEGAAATAAPTVTSPLAMGLRAFSGWARSRSKSSTSFKR